MVLPSELPLPDECIDLIVAYLVEERQALHALVCSSQRLLERTLPVLYRSPFQLIENSSRWSRDEKEKRSTALLALLLTTRKPEHPTHPNPTTAYTHTQYNHPRYHQRNQYLDHQNHRPATIDYLRFFTHQYQINLWRPLVNLRTLASEENMFILDESQNMTELQISVAESLVRYSPKDIKVIGQPIDRVSSVLVPSYRQLRNLVRLELSEIAIGFKIAPVIEFIRVHDANHHTLREIKIKGRDDPAHPSHAQLYQLVQAMRSPQVVDARHWREAITVLHEIPSECLRTLLLGMADMPPTFASVPDFLSRCVFLEELRMPVRDENLFDWAIAHRRSLGVDRNASLSRSRSLPMASAQVPTYTMLSSSFASYPGSVPVPSPMPMTLPWQLHHYNHLDWQVSEHAPGSAHLRSIDLCGEDRCLIPALRSAVDAFRDSLEVLKAMSLALMMTRVPILNIITLGWSWPLSRLSVLDLEGEVALAFKLSSLRYCPALVKLKLSLPPYLYSTSEDDQTLQAMKDNMPKICYATRLLELELHGKWPVSDGLLLMITQNIRRLTRLHIVSCGGYTLDGIQTLVSGLERLEWLGISKWLCAWQPMRYRLLAMKAQKPRLELVEGEVMKLQGK